MTIESEAATSTKRYHPPPGSALTNRNEGNFPNLELFHQSSKPRKTDKASLGTSEAGERRKDRITKKKRESSKNKNTVNTTAGISKQKKDKLLLHLETESSGSQTSDFELRLSDSSTDAEDFQSTKKVSKINALSTKIESFYVAKQAQVHSNTYSGKSSITSQNRKSSSGNQTRTSRKFETCSSSSFHKQECILEAPSTLPLKTGEIFGTHSEKDAENFGFTGESRKQKKTAMCLMFTDAKPDKKSEKKIHKNSGKTEEVKNECTSSRNCEKNQEEDKASVSRKPREERKLSGKRIFLDACIKLERVSVEELKSRNSKMNVFDNSSQSVKKTVHLAAKTKDCKDCKRRNDAATGTGLSLKAFTEPFPITFVNEEEVACFRCPPDEGGTPMDMREHEVEICEDVSTVSPEISVVRETGSSSNEGGTSMDLRGHEVEICEDVSTVSPKMSVVCETGGSSNEGGTSMDMREHQVEICEDVSTVSPEISVVCETGGSSNEGGTSMDMREHQVEICEDVSTVSPEISVVCETGGSSNEGGTSMDMREHQVEICEDVSTVSPEISVVCETGGSSNEGGTSMDLREHQVEICEDVSTVSPEISVVCETGGSSNEGGTPMDMRGHQVEICKDVNIVSPDVSVVCESSGSSNEGGTSMDLREHQVEICEDGIFSPKISVVCESGGMQKDKVGVSGDENATSFGLSAVCDSFSGVKEQASLDIEEMLKDIESPLVLERQESFGEININSHVESSVASGLQILPSKTYSKSLADCKGHDQSDQNIGRKIWKPAIEAPSPSYVLKTRRLYGLPHKRYQKAFCSDLKDIPSAARYARYD